MSERQNRLVIGLTGPVGSGVSTVAGALKENGFSQLKLSDPIKLELARRKKLEPLLPLDEEHVPNFRKLLQDIGNEGRERSTSHWVDEVLKDGAPDTDLVIDGIRNVAEVDSLRARFPEFFLIAVYAAPTTRWERVKDQYNRNLGTFERDDARDSNEDVPTGQQVANCVQHADYALINEDDDGSMHTRGEKLFDRLKPELDLMRSSRVGTSGEGFRRPATADEVHMATAYAQSHNSRCLKRYVGAVIVDGKNIPLSLGYNENPIGMKPCIAEFKHCYKDEDMHRKLERMGGVRCPGCGRVIQHVQHPWICRDPKCRENLKLRFFPNRNMELCTAVHAEERAIRSLGPQGANGGTIFTTTFPCFQCSRSIVDAEIKRVVYVEAYPVKESLGFLQRNGVFVEPFQGFKARAFNLVFKQRE